jgi:hypothetical protein
MLADKPCAVTGKVTVNGAPAAGLYLMFQPTDAKAEHRPTLIKTRKDGSFSAQMPGPGEYVVNAVWPEEETDETGVKSEGEDYFSSRWRDPANPIRRVSITLGENALPPIDLKFDPVTP